SGNFGNIAAGMIAHKMGLPVKQFIAATNSNDIVPQYLETGIYTARPSVQTLANAMDVGDPSNFVRILDLFDNDKAKLEEKFSSVACDGAKVTEAIVKAYDKEANLRSPHAATAYPGSEAEKAAAKQTQGNAYVMLSTAHPCTFPAVFAELRIAYA